MTSEPAPVEESFEMNPHWITTAIRVYSRVFASIRGLNISPPPRTSFVVEPAFHGSDSTTPDLADFSRASQTCCVCRDRVNQLWLTFPERIN